MRKNIVLACLMSLLISGCLTLSAVPLFDHFDGDTLNVDFWNQCQISERAPVILAKTKSTQVDYARIRVDETSLGGNKCEAGSAAVAQSQPGSAKQGVEQILNSEISTIPTVANRDNRYRLIADEDAEDLGLSFVKLQKMVDTRSLYKGTPQHQPSTVQTATANPYCTPAVMKRARMAEQEGECIQRQELRPKKGSQRSDRPALYSFRFRTPHRVHDITNSIRWITAQWKQEPVSEHYRSELGEWDPSPFLAQRFDDGVLHVTVQDEHCSCLVASAPLPNGGTRKWRNGVADLCRSIRPGPGEGAPCIPELRVEYGANPVLASPQQNWVEMSYRVQASRIQPSVIEIHQNGRFIVRVTGKIGYAAPKNSVQFTKFKIGHYRDYMPFEDAVDYDWVRIQPLTR